MISTLYRGSVKDLLGPAQLKKSSALIFEYSDAYSVFDWGRMPDLLNRKGQALAILAADLFEKLEKPENWKEFSKSPLAFSLRKANRFGGVFNELGEDLQSKGLRTHYLGVIGEVPTDSELDPKLCSEIQQPFRRMAVRQVSVVKPTLSQVLGRSLPDYFPTRAAPLPRLVPLEVVFRFSCPEGSSLFDRVQKNPSYLTSLGYPEQKLHPGIKWDFPVLELFTKLEATDRPLPLSEALAISGMSATQLQEVLLKTVWVAGILKYWFSKSEIELCDGKLEWAISESGESFLVDAVGPDELRLMKEGVQLSKEFIRTLLRKTPWFLAVENAKSQAKTQGVAEWKRFVHENAPSLTAFQKELATQVYLSLTNEITGKKWFSDAWDLKRVVRELVQLNDQRDQTQNTKGIFE